jgi:hypothetical protein
VAEVLIEGYRLDVKDGLDFSFNYSIADVRDPNKRSTSYSKTIKCPSTKANDILFGNIWEINIANAYDPTLSNVNVNFNPNKKAEARVVHDGVEVMVGVVQLRKIVVQNTKLEYEVVFIGKLLNIFSELGEKQANGFEVVNGVRTYYLDFSDQNHLLNYTNITNSWDYNAQYVYPMVDTGESTLSDSQGRRIWKPQDFKPWLKLKALVDKIFDYAGFTYTSTFFDSALFDRLITSEIKDVLMSQDEMDLRNAQVTIGTTYNIINTGITTIPSGQVSVVRYDTVVYDQSLQFVPGAYLYLSEFESLLNLSSTVALTNTRTRQSYYSFGTFTVYRYDILANGNCDVYNHDTNTLIASNQSTSLGLGVLTGDVNSIFNPPFGSYSLAQLITEGLTNQATRDLWIISPIDWLIGFDLLYGSRQPVFYQRLRCSNNIIGDNIIAEEPFNFFTQVDIGESNTLTSYVSRSSQHVYNTDQIYAQWYFPDSVFDGRVAQQAILIAEFGNEYNTTPQGTFIFDTENSGLIEWQTMDMNTMLPDVQMSELLVSVFKMFNLYVTVDPLNENNLIIETRDDFYGGGVTRDWTHKLAKNKNVSLEPLGLLTAREYLYTYTEDKDYYNERYQNNIGRTYGSRKIEIDNDFIKNTTEVPIVFSPTPLVNDNPSNRIIPKIYDADIEEGAKPTEANIRVLYYAGNITSTPSWVFQHLPAPPLNVLGGLITTTVATYPYAGHLDNPITPSLDLNFGIPLELYYQPNAITGTLQYTNANLFNVYHRTYIDEITDKDSKVLTAEFYLDAWDIAKLDFRDQILLENSYWRLNQVNDYNPFKEGLTKVELIKVRDIAKQPVEVFNLGIAGSTGNQGTSEKKPLTGRKLLKNGNLSPQFKGSVNGHNNIVGDSVDSFKIIGNNNVISDASKNVTILGDGNYVSAGLENVVIINSDNQEVYDSDVVIVNNYKMPNCRIQCASLTIASADVLQLNSTPLTIVDAPGAGYAIEVLSTSINLTYNSAAYATNTTIQVESNGATTPQFRLLNGINQTISSHRSLGRYVSANTETQIIENADLMVTVASGDPTAGDSDIEILVLYRIISV